MSAEKEGRGPELWGVKFDSLLLKFEISLTQTWLCVRDTVSRGFCCLYLFQVYFIRYISRVYKLLFQWLKSFKVYLIRVIMSLSSSFIKELAQAKAECMSPYKFPERFRMQLHMAQTLQVGRSLPMMRHMRYCNQPLSRYKRSDKTSKQSDQHRQNWKISTCIRITRKYC